MRSMFAVSAGVSLLLIVSGTGWAAGRGRARNAPETGKDKEVSSSFNKQFQWEEKVVGPKDKGVDHDKIAAMQEQGRREDAAKKRDEMAGVHAKKPARADGITGPATATLPTMDIEKPAPAGSVRSPMKKASYTPPAPRHRDDIDNVLAENGSGDGSGASGEGLGSLLGSKPHAAARPAARSTKHAKHARARRRR